MKNIKNLIENLKLELTEEIRIRKHSGILIPSSKLHSLIESEIGYSPNPQDFKLEIVDWDGDNMELELRDIDPDSPGIIFNLNLEECGIDLLIQILSLSEDI